MASSRRLDVELVARGLAPSRHRAQQLIAAGAVAVAGRTATKPSMAVSSDVAIEVADAIPYVSRGGLKLAAALTAFALSPAGKVVMDVGSSTGGFTDVLLRSGARLVYAVDVGHGQLAASLRGESRVVCMEGTDIRALAELPERVQMAVVDVSFISLRLVLPAVERHLDRSGDAVVLFKPQFEAGPGLVGSDGVLRDGARRLSLVRAFCEWAATAGWAVLGALLSPITGGDGNVEYLLHLGRRADLAGAPPEIETVLGTLGCEHHLE